MKPLSNSRSIYRKCSIYSFFVACLLALPCSVFAQNFNHPLSGDQEHTLAAGSYNYYDSGGPNGNYSNNTNSSIFFTPETGYFIQWRIISYNIEEPVCGGECCDLLTASWLPNCGDLFWQTDFCGSGGLGDFVTLCAGEGLFFNFTSDNSVTPAGWNILIVVELKDPFNMDCNPEGNCLDVRSLECGGIVGGQGEANETRMTDEEFNCSAFGPCTGSVDYYPQCDDGYYPGPERVYAIELDEAQDLIFSCECITDVFLVQNSSCEYWYCWKAEVVGGQFVLPNVEPGFYGLYAEYDCEGSDACFCDLQFECLDPGAADDCPESCCQSFVVDYSKCVDFESYNTGNIVPQGTPPFELFSGLSNQQAVVSTLQHYSGTKSLRFTTTSDIVFLINRTIDAPTRLEWMTYIPSGKTGAFGFYTFNPIYYPINVEYINGIATIYNESEQGNLEVGSFSYSPNTWFKNVILFLPEDDKIEYWQNGILRYTLTNFTSNQVGELNFYLGEIGTSEFFIDDICYREKLPDYPCTLDYNPVCVNGVSYSNSCIAASAGYSECEWTEGECESGGCADCDECFFFLPRFETTTIIDFQSQYCFNGIPNFHLPEETRMVTTTYQWNVPNATEQYVNGTSSISQNPSIQFPGTGSYTVCQQVFENGTLVFECCRTVFVGACNTPPVAFFSAQAVLFNRFLLNADANGNHLQWRLLDPDAFFFEGTENSPNPVVVLPGGTCTTVCLYVTNACGTSSYCMEICVNDPNCSGSTPPVWITNEIEPFSDDKLIQIDLPNPPGGGTATYDWDFGDGEMATTQNISHSYADYGNYTVCVTMTIGCRTWCYCWTIRLNPCQSIYTNNSGDLQVQFSGSETNLQYTITTSVPKASGENWLVNGLPVSGNTSSLIYTFPSAGNYTVCFPYLGIDGCIHYYCVDIGAGNPFACSNITWQFATATGYHFSIPAGNTQISWSIDETGQDIGNSSTSNWVLPISPCNWRTISVKYFDGSRYRICCLRIYLCPPDECAASIAYGYLASTNQATFALSANGASEITWFFDDAPSQSLGTAVNLAIPYPGTCLSRWISVRYKDSIGHWRICCRQIYFCNPIACSAIRVNYSASSGYSFTVDQVQQQMSWIVEETGASLGSGMASSNLPVGATCEYRTVSLRYWDPLVGWRLCCLRFYWCNPTTCSDIITFNTNGNSLVLNAPDNLQEVNWYQDSTFLGGGNPLSTSLSTAWTHTICIRYLDLCDNAWKWCCRTYTPGGSSGNLTFDFADAVCGELNEIVEIPLRVRGFSNIINFQLSVQIADTTKGKLISLVPQSIPGDLETVVNSAQTGGMYWENQSPVSLSDNTIIAIARVHIVSQTGGQTDIRITGDPIPLYAEDGSGNEVIPTLLNGSFCFETLISICGNVTREDLLPIANVNMTLQGCQQFQTKTDANGNYCFVDVPSGKSYQVFASKDTNDKNGVNSGDLTAIKRHILNVVKLNTPYKIAAADAKKSSEVNTGDVSELRRLILGSISALPTCESWEFTDKNFVFPNPANPFSSGWPLVLDLPNVMQDISNADMIGWKMGDVNLSNKPQSVSENEWNVQRSMADIYLFASSENVQGLDTFWVNITTRAFQNISNGQFSLRYDPATFILHDVGQFHPSMDLSSDNFHIDQVNGSLGFVWDAIAGVTIPDDSILFSLKFTSKLSQVVSSEVSFSEDPVSYYFENFDGEELNVITSNGEVTVPTNEIHLNELLVIPNPNTGRFTITGLEGTIDQLEVIDSRGLTVVEQHNVLNASRVNLYLPQAGLYMIRVRQTDNVYLARVVVTR
jgi:hypothetical protein